jgi:peptidoglycan/xylan/chitin deacetylase (PgdA/CDA1 family)
VKLPESIAVLGGAVAAGMLAAFAVWLVAKPHEPPLPAVVTQTTDAHRLLSRSPAAFVDRYLHERPPAVRSKNPRLIALSFDDGPYPVETPLLLDVLSDLHVPATFFLIGDDTAHFPKLAQRIAAAGDEIANHTQTHPERFDLLPAEVVKRELDDGARTLERYVRDPAIRHMMRPPHGRFSESTVVAAQKDGYSVVLWNDDPGDWRTMSPEAIASHMAAHATAPDIVLLHSGRLATIEAMPLIVARFRAAGFTFVTVSQLLARIPPAEVLHPVKLKV